MNSIALPQITIPALHTLLLSSYDAECNGPMPADSKATDAQLIALHLQGDTDAFTTLIDRYGPALYG